MDTSEVRKIVGSKIFSAEFTKKDGSTRKMLCKLGVKKHLKGGVKKYDSEALNYLTVYSLDSQGYRAINLNTLKSIKCGKVYKV
tara:strand:- start:666 stop:917 length:252 start_codon:yes stop_codon:yes gene_type:complete